MRVNTTITIAAGTPVNVAVSLKLCTAAQLATIPPIYASRWFAEMLHGGTGLGYLMIMDAFAAGTTPSHSTSGHLTGEMAPASATAPGGNFGDASSGSPAGGPLDLTKVWIDGSVTSDTVVFTAEIRN